MIVSWFNRHDKRTYSNIKAKARLLKISLRGDRPEQLVYPVFSELLPLRLPHRRHNIALIVNNDTVSLVSGCDAWSRDW